jgi:hypothetical protein
MGGPAMNLEARLRRLEQERGHARTIILTKTESEDSDALLADNGIAATDDDLVISVARFQFDDPQASKMPPFNQRIVSIHERAA